MRNVCTQPECDRFVNGRGLCRTHYWQMAHHGVCTPIRPPSPPRQANDPLTEQDIARFQSKVPSDVGPEECWLWMGSVRGRYGRFHIGRKAVNANRIAYRIANGDIPDGLIVCHTCDVPLCVNPAHLFVGTFADNSADMAAKGRAGRVVGEQNPRSHLTEADVRAIRADARTHRQIAADYGISSSTVSKIRTRETWRHVA